MPSRFSTNDPKDEHLSLLRTLACCPPNKGYVVGKPGPAIVEAFRACESVGWVESVSFGVIRVWKVTQTGRHVFNISLARHMSPTMEC